MQRRNWKTMADTSIGTPEQLRDPELYATACTRRSRWASSTCWRCSSRTSRRRSSSPGPRASASARTRRTFPELIYLIQMSMLFAGIATLFQTIEHRPGRRGAADRAGHVSFAFLPIMIPLVAGKGVDALAALFGGVIIGGLFHAFLGTFIGKIRFALPPLVTGLVVTMIGLALVKVGIQYAAGGVPAIGTPEYGSLLNWSAALVVIFVTLGLKFFARGMLSVSAVLIGLLVGYVYAHRHRHGARSTRSPARWGRAAAFALPHAVQVRVRVLARGDHRLLPDGLRLGGRDRGRRVRHHQGRRRPRGDRQGNPGRDLCRRSRHRGRRPLRRLAQHLVQPERRPDRDDRRDEPPCGDHRRDLPDHLRADPQGRRASSARCRSRCWAAA